MAVRMKWPGKRVLALLGILAVFAAGCIGFTGCRHILVTRQGEY